MRIELFSCYRNTGPYIFAVTGGLGAPFWSYTGLIRGKYWFYTKIQGHISSNKVDIRSIELWYTGLTKLNTGLIQEYGPCIANHDGLIREH